MIFRHRLAPKITDNSVVAMKKKKGENKINTFTQQFTSTFSVMLVLLIFGIVLSLVSAAREEMKSVKENIGFNAVLAPDATDEDLAVVRKTFEALPYIKSYEYFSPEEILKAEQDEIGEDIVELLGVNPYPGEFDVKVTADYANNDSISSVAAKLLAYPMIDSIDSRADTIDGVNRSLSTISLILSAIALALMIVSFVLINNTVWLTIYSRRFIIHTMRLVGATAGFIRRPIILNNLINGLIAGAAACIILTALRIYAATFEAEIEIILPWTVMFIIYGLMILAGILICCLGAYFATNRYLRRSYDELF